MAFDAPLSWDLIKLSLKSDRFFKPLVVIEKSILLFSRKKGFEGANSQCFSWDSKISLFLKGSSTLYGLG